MILLPIFLNFLSNFFQNSTLILLVNFVQFNLQSYSVQVSLFWNHLKLFDICYCPELLFLALWWYVSSFSRPFSPEINAEISEMKLKLQEWRSHQIKTDSLSYHIFKNRQINQEIWFSNWIQSPKLIFLSSRKLIIIRWLKSIQLWINLLLFKRINSINTSPLNFVDVNFIKLYLLA